MSTLVIEREALAQKISFTDVALIVELDDGRSLSIPLTWYPRLLHAFEDELNNYEIIGEGEGIHWHDLDEDISIEGLLAGRRSNEKNESLSKWLQQRMSI